MAEGSQEAAAMNYQKTVAAQKERTTRVEKPTGFVDNFFGKFTFGSIVSSYKAGTGGQVSTSITSGEPLGERACLDQTWQYDSTGNLTGVLMSKVLSGSGEVSRTKLERGADGKFVIKEHQVKLRLDDWERRFNTAAKRMKR